MNRPPTPSNLLAFLALTLPLACNSASNDDAGPPITAQEYFNLGPGQCFQFTSGDAGRPTRGLLVQAVASPPGEVALQTLKRGQIEQIEYLTFDGGVVFLNQRDVYPGPDGGNIDSRLFASPLTYLLAPMSPNQSDLTSGSSYSGTSAGFESFAVSILDHDTWDGIGSDAGGSESFNLQFSAQDDGGGGLTQDKRMLPWVGFVQILAPDDLGTFVTFTLVGIQPADGGICGG